MDSDAEGVPSEFFDYFKVSGSIAFNFLLSILLFWPDCAYDDSLLGSLHSRVPDMSQTC